MTDFLQVLVSGILIGLIYALISSGLNLVWGVCNVLNVTHGEFMITGSYLTYFGTRNWGLNPLLTLPISAGVLFVVGVVVQYVLVERLVGVAMTMSFIMLFGLSAVARNLGEWTLGPTYHTVNYYTGSYSVGAGVQVPHSYVVIAIVSVVTLVAMQFYLSRSRMGIATSATAANPAIAQSVGINVRLVRCLTMGLAGAMAGIAGSCLIFVFPVNPDSGVDYAIFAFTVVVLGGMGSFVGSIIGGLLLGVIVGLTGLYIGNGASLAIGYVVLAVVLLVRPSGIVGRPQGVRA